MKNAQTRLLVDNYRECFLFYRDVLGFSVLFGDEDSNYTDFKFNGSTLALFERKQMMDAVGKDNKEPNENSDHALLTFEVDSVDKTYQELSSKVDFVTEPFDKKEWGVRVVHFRDPAGTLLELHEPL